MLPLVVDQEIKGLPKGRFAGLAYGVGVPLLLPEAHRRQHVRKALEGAVRVQGTSPHDGQPEHSAGHDVLEGHGVVVRGVAPVDVDDVRQDHEVVERRADALGDLGADDGEVGDIPRGPELQHDLRRVQEEELHGGEDRELAEDRLELQREHAAEAEVLDAELRHSGLHHDVGVRLIVHADIQLHLKAIMVPRACSDRPKPGVIVAERELCEVDAFQGLRQGRLDGGQHAVLDELLEAGLEVGPGLLHDPREPAHGALRRLLELARDGRVLLLVGIATEAAQVEAVVHLELQLQLQGRGVAAEARRVGGLVQVEAVQLHCHNVLRPEAGRHVGLVELQEVRVEPAGQDHAAAALRGRRLLLLLPAAELRQRLQPLQQPGPD
mmetsp:Transcript_100792/g.325323  ORF Transcript_100792/g.325323 Transcript_100792/m.325323 type:complete len:381 (+) Transcript_100792:999-2141(+)